MLAIRKSNNCNTYQEGITVGYSVYCVEDEGQEKILHVNACLICGKPVEGNDELCMNCQIEKFISENSAQIEM